MLNCLIRFFEFIFYLEIEFFERGFFLLNFIISMSIRFFRFFMTV